MKNTLECPATMGKTVRHIGPDVHKETISVAVAETEQQPRFLKTISHDLHAVEKLVAELREGGHWELRFCYSRSLGRG